MKLNENYKKSEKYLHFWLTRFGIHITNYYKSYEVWNIYTSTINTIRYEQFKGDKSKKLNENKSIFSSSLVAMSVNSF